MTILITAGWLDPEETIGALHIVHTHGNEVMSVELDKKWIERHPALLLDPDLTSYRGIQYPPADKQEFGMLSDSSPDRWGRKLIEREEMRKADLEKRALRTLKASDYLLGISDTTRYGGIRFKNSENGRYLSFSNAKVPPMTDIRMLESAARGYESMNDADGHLLEILLEPGSSLGGARPKANVQDVDGSLWIAKFPSKKDEYDTGKWEMVEHDLAELCGLNVPQARIMKLSPYGSTFLSKRFDRNRNKRFHLMSAMTALGLTDGHTDGVGYLDLAASVEQISVQPEKDLEELWRRMIFNILTSNCDDHLRNHGFILLKNGWKLSPAYDLNPVMAKNSLSLNITDTDSRRSLPNAVSVAEFFRISEKDAHTTIIQMQEIIRDNFEKTAEKYQISSGEISVMKSAYSLCFS